MQKNVSFQSIMKSSMSIIDLENHFEGNTMIFLEWETNPISE